jgi:hypothetical protein
MYTSGRPDSSDAYASHRPSGEMAGLNSSAFVATIARATVSPGIIA